jgi:hypothetical protein
MNNECTSSMWITNGYLWMDCIQDDVANDVSELLWDVIHDI